MSDRDFMHVVWPDAGYYCLAFPATTRAGKSYYQHVVFDTIDAALSRAAQEKAKRDVYFAVLSLRQREYVDLSKPDPRTGEPGLIRTRCGANMLAARCFFFDIDAGPTKPYPDAGAAIAALVDFTNAAELPKPTIISSGRGLHVYWIVDTTISVDKWVPVESQLRQLAIHHGLKIDPSRTTDVTSLLRVPGTLNHKDPLNPLPVAIWKQAPILSLDDFTGLLSAATVRAGVDALTQAAPAATTSILGSNTDKTYDGPLVSLGQVKEVCAQVRDMVAAKGNLDQPAWYQGQLGTIKWVKDGHTWCHSISAGSPTYSQAETDAKLAQLEPYGPSSCATIARVMPGGEALCKQCPFYGKVANPLVAARKFAAVEVEATPREVQDEPGIVVAAEALPAPRGFLHTDAGIVRTGKREDGEETTEVIHDYWLRPIRRLTDPAEGREVQEWEANMPREGWKTFQLPAGALYDSRSMTSALANVGIYLGHSHIGAMVEYMTAYIQMLQKERDAEIQATHMGWTKDFDGFILPGRLLTATETKPLGMSAALEQRVEAIHKAGTMENQIRLMRFYEDERYIPSQIVILASLAAPLFHMTGHHGVVINASGDTGASKSTTIYTASSAWGHPTEYTLNGTNNGATPLARDAKVDAYANLAVTVDEITYMPVKDIQNLVMGITQPSGRLRLKKDGTERRQSGGHKSTILIASANSSIHGLLSSDNTAGTAGSMRVLEMMFRPTGVHTKPEADQFLRELKENYGHIGPAFIRFVLQNYEKVKKRVHSVMAEIDTEGNIEPSERFISGVFAVVLVAGEIAKAMGLLRYDVAKIREHMLRVELPHHRGVIVGEYSSPLSILADYIQMIHGNTIVIKPTMVAGGNTQYASNGPRGALLAHMDQVSSELVMLKRGFKDYCTKVGASMTKILSELSKPTTGGTIIVETNAKRTIGAGTEYAAGQSWCIVVNMAHPDIASKLPPDHVAQVVHLRAVP